MKEKDEKNSEKMSMLFYNELKLQPYLTQQEISTKDKQMMYKFRTKMIKVSHKLWTQNCMSPLSYK